MSKDTGLGDQLYVDGFDLSGDIGAVQSLNKTFAEQDVTGLDKSAIERILLLEDGEIGFANYYNPTAATHGLHDELSDLPDTDALVSYFRGVLLGAVTASLLGKQVNYGLARGNDGALIGENIAVKGSGYGLEYGYALTAGKKHSTSAETLPGLDGDLSGYISGSNDPTVFVLHMFAMTGAAGDDVTVQIWHSNDDGGTDVYTLLTSFTNVDISAVPTAERITKLTTHAKRWLQVRTVPVSNYPTTVDFAVAAIRGIAL